MPHRQEQVIRGRKVKLSPLMVYSSTSPSPTESWTGPKRGWAVEESQQRATNGHYSTAKVFAKEGEAFDPRGPLNAFNWSRVEMFWSVSLVPWHPLILSVIATTLNKSEVTRDIVSVGQSTIKMKGKFMDGTFLQLIWMLINKVGWIFSWNLGGS